MNGYIIVIGNCFACKRPFGFNADHVPSVPGEISGTGTREPICRTCVERANPERIKNGLEPIAIHPLAYEPEVA
jgi:hypothetical protein